MLLVFVILLFMEDMPGITSGSRSKFTGFFWGMVTMIVSLIILSDQSETWPVLIFTVIVTLLAIVGLIIRLKHTQTSSQPLS
jgi:hypothetical protein